jgi:gluconate 2-dehydrogenase gamma chain
MHDLAKMDRRALMQHVALLLGAAAIPGEAIASMSKAKARHFLPPAQYALLGAIADTIIPATDTPGAAAVGVPRLLEGMIANWASAKRKAALMTAMSEIDQLALASDKKPFAALAPARRKALLIPYDKEALKPGPAPKEKLNGILALSAGPPVANPAYLKLKELVIALYYSSEVASSRELVYEHIPGEWVPSLKITPETRPYAGVGGLF